MQRESRNTIKFNKDDLYWYMATVVSIYDGDSFTLDVDLGFEIRRISTKIRVVGIDTPEMRGVERPQGIVAKLYAEKKVLGKTIPIRTEMDEKGKYGRWLVEPFYHLEGDVYESLPARMIEIGLGVPY